MENLLRSHKNNHYCSLGMPDGLKELMADISREVLRASPDDILGFIAQYLPALLITRENAFVAQRILDDVCDCHPRLSHHFLDIGLTGEQAQKAVAIINKHFNNDAVKEKKLLKELLEQTEIKPEQLPGVCDMIREAYLQFKNHNITVEHLIEDPEDLSEAVHNTVNFYQKQSLDQDDLDQMAERIQLAYKNYKHKRNKANSSTSSNTSMALEKTIRFETNMTELYLSPSYPETGTLRSHSSMTLSGSSINYPKYHPYSTSDHTTSDSIPEVDVDAATGSTSGVPRINISRTTDLADPDDETLIDYEKEMLAEDTSKTDANDPRDQKRIKFQKIIEELPDDSETTSSSEIAITVHSMSVEDVHYNINSTDVDDY